MAVAYYSILINMVSLFSKEKAAEMAINIFKRPRNGRPKGRHLEYLKKHKAGQFQSQGLSHSYYHWSGKGDSILLLHGWESNSVRWKPYIEDLQKRDYNIYAFDAPAHGLSEGHYFTPELYADAIQDFLEKHNIKIILGHSVGAYATLIYCKRPIRSDHLKHLILLAPTGKIRDFMNRFFDILKLNTSIRDHYFNNFQKLYQHELEYYDSDNLVQGIGLDGILIHDKNDITLPYKDSELIAANWPEGKFITTEGFGHRLKSTEVTKQIFAYLDTLSVHTK